MSRQIQASPARGRSLGGMLAGAIVLAAALQFPASPAPAATVSTQEVEEGLTCQCGCGLTAHSCNHVSCGSAIPLRREVRTLVEQGLGRDEILLAFRNKYGEKILAAPTTEGFNLTAWVLPFVLLGAGSLVVVLTIRRWAKSDVDEAPPPPASLSEEDRERVERALRENP